jgi:hypothetical protein
VDGRDVTQVMPVAETPSGQAPTDSEPTAPTEVPASKAAVPRRWFAAAVIAALLIAAGLGFYLGTRGEDEPVVEEETEVAEAETATVPDLRGMTLERATADAETAGLVIGTTVTAVVEESVTPAGTVLSQDPLPGVEVESGAAISLVIAEAPAADAGSPPSGSSGDSGSTATQPPPAPSTPEISDLSLLTVKPKIVDIGVIILQQEWTTVLEHQASDSEWMSPGITLGDGEKRMLFTADGAQGYLLAAYSWGPGDAYWKIRSFAVSAPGSSPYETVLDVPAGTHTFMVKSSNTAVLWTLAVQEKK